MKYIIDYEFTEEIEGYTVNNEIIFDCLMDSRPFSEMTYVNIIIKNEKGEDLGEKAKSDINFTNFVMNYNMKKGFVIEQIFEGEEYMYNIYNEVGELIAKDLVHRSRLPKISLDGTVNDRL